MNNHVMSYIPHRLKRPSPPAFRFNPDGKKHWLQWICIGILEKLGCAIGGWDEYVEFKTMNLGPLLDQIKDMLIGTNYVLHGEPIKYIVVGRDVMMELMEDPAMFFISPYLDEPGVLYGMKVVCIPWMHGLVLLPDLEKCQ